MKPFRSPTPESPSPGPGTIRAGTPDGGETTLGAAAGVLVVGVDVDVGTWSGSVRDIESKADSLKLEKINDDWVSHWNWVLLEGGGELVDGGVDTESGVDEGGGGVPEGKLTKVSLIQKSTGRNLLESDANTLGRRWNYRRVERR